MLMRKAKLPGDGRNQATYPLHLLKLDLNGGRIHGGNQLSETGHYAEPRMQVNQKTRLRVTADLRPQIADALRAARKTLGLTQTALAEALGSSQGAVTRWERAIDSPPFPVFGILAKLVPDEQRGFWLEMAGSDAEEVDVTSQMRSIPVLRDSAAAGTPRVINEAEIDYTLLFPQQLVPAGGKLVGVKVEGDSMSPILENGFVVLVDTSQREIVKLVGKMVAARDESGGVTIKWLRKQGKMLLLVPQNTSPRHEVRIISEGDDFGIVGEVVKWIGSPHPSPKRK